MLQILKDRKDFITACSRAAKMAVENECTTYVAYIAREDRFTISDWFDDATVCKFDETEEIEWL